MMNSVYVSLLLPFQLLQFPIGNVNVLCYFYEHLVKIIFIPRINTYFILTPPLMFSTVT